MTVTSAYMYTVKNLPAMFEAIQKAQVPPRFTHEFLQTLGFKSTNDRAFINVLKGLGLLDSNAVPTQVYRDYRDKAVAKRILAQQIRTAYQGLYMTDENAHDLSVEAVKGKLNSLTGKDETVVAKMATTFSALAKLADFKESLAPKKVTTPEEEIVESPALAPTPSKQLQGIAFSHACTSTYLRRTTAQSTTRSSRALGSISCEQSLERIARRGVQGADAPGGDRGAEGSG